MGEVVQMHFTTVDYVIFALLLVASAGIGLFYAFSGGRQRTTQVRAVNISLTFLTTALLPCSLDFIFPWTTGLRFVL